MMNYQWAAGSIIGSEHQRISKNNQDAFVVREVNDALIGMVADGCGSCPRSEVGAWLGVEFVAQAIADHLPADLDQDFFKTLTQKIIDTFPTELSPQKYLLFTLLGFVITPIETIIFGCGDGMMAINGEVTIWDFENNAPPYLIYPDENVTIIQKIATSELQSLLIATDGLEAWHQHKDIADFWTNSKYFKNPDQIRRTLTVGQRKESFLKDDTTLIVVRPNPKMIESKGK